MAETDADILVLDASVLINFLRINRVDLLRNHPCQILITEHVIEEITSAYSEQAGFLKAALRDEIFRIVRVEDVAELADIARFRSGKAQLGVGECSAIVIAARRNFAVACDDRVAISHARKWFPAIVIFKTEDLVVHLIKADVLDVAAADAIKDLWEQQCRFRIKFRSFADLLN